MKRKILASFMLLVLIFTNYAYAAYTRYPREGGYRLNNYATIINDILYLPSKFNAQSIRSNDVKIYYADGHEVPIDYSDNHFIVRDGYGYYRLKLEPDSVAPHALTFKIKDGIKCGDKKYNVKIVIGEIRVDGGIKNATTQPELQVRVQSVKQENDTITPSGSGVYPHIYIIPTNGGKVEVNVDYYIYKEVNNQEENVAVNGIMELTDIDLQQGIVIGGYQSTPENTFIKDRTTQYINLVTDENVTHIYSLTDADLGTKDDDPNCDAYLKMENFKHGKFVFTYDSLSAGSNLIFDKNIYKNYHTITTKVIGGTIKEKDNKNLTEIKDDETRTIAYAPSNSNKYLEYIKVDGANVSISDDNKSSYSFNDIKENHNIEVKYSDKIKVTFDSQGGTPDYVYQYKIPGEKATKIAEPTKDGYDFVDWYTEPNGTTKYNFDTPVEKDITIYAKWKKKDVNHNINYIIDGASDNTVGNPTSYKEGDTNTLTIKKPTKTGYTFSGWYENQNLTGSPVTNLNVTNRTSDITLYGKWTKNPDPSADYKVKYYLEDENGTKTHNGKKYSEDTSATQTKQGTVNSTVTETTTKTYTGYTVEKNTASGTVKADNTLELEFYYNKNQYTVTFDTKGGAPVPSNQTVKYNEKATKPTTDPTKNGYEFKYWYDSTTNGEVPYNFSAPITSNKTLIAKWEEVVPADVTHDINYVIDGIADKTTGNIDKYKEGSTSPITLINPSKSGYTFSGWYDNEELTGTSITKLDVSNKTTDITLYGKYTKNEVVKVKYDVIHYLEDENGSETYNGKKYKIDKTENKEIEVNVPFTEYASSYEGYEAEKSSQGGVVTENGTLKIDFYYNKKQYKVTFDTQGGNPVPDAQTKKYGDKVTKPENPTKDGYNFLYWYTEEDGKKVIYDFDQVVKSDKDLIAEWEKVEIIKDVSSNQPTTQNQTITPKQDTTTAEQTILPKTGIVGKTIISVLAIAIVGIIFAMRYRKLRDIK